MALTKVSGHIIDQPFDVGIITATNFRSGVATVGTMHVTGNLQVDGTTTTLDTVVTEVDRLEVSANNSTVGAAITQSGSGDILNLYDGSTEVFSVLDGGDVGIARSIFHLGDTNTSIGFPSDDTIKLQVNGSQLNYIDVNSTRTRFYRPIMVGDYISHATVDSLGVKFSNAGAGNNNTNIGLAAEDNGVNTNHSTFRVFRQGGIYERMRIHSNGNIGINSTAPIDKLSVSADNYRGVTVESSTTAHRPTLSLRNTADSRLAYIQGVGNEIAFGRANVNYSGHTEVVRIDGSGRVGIGVTNPGSFFANADNLVVGTGSGNNGITIFSGNASSNEAALVFADGRTGSEVYIGRIVYRHDSDSLAFDTNAGERLRITSNGELKIPAGIGPQITFENQHGHTGDAVISTYDDGVGTLLCLGSNFYFNSSGAETRYNTSEESAGVIVNRNGQINFNTGDTSATATTRLTINSAGQLKIPDDGQYTVGDSHDGRIYYNSSNDIFYIYNNSANGGTIIQNNSAGGGIALQPVPNENGLVCFPNSSVRLYYDASEKFRTTTTGAKVTGALEVTQEYPSIRPTLDLNFAATKTLDRRITFTRDSIGTYVDDMGIVRTAPNNTPRFDHSGTGECLGLLIEESRTNLNLYSHLDGGNWTSQFATSNNNVWTTNVSGVTDPAGNNNAAELKCNGTSANYSYRSYYGGHSGGTTSGTTYTFSLFVKPNGLTTCRLAVDSAWAQGLNTFTLTGNGSVTPAANTNATIEYVGNGWYRCSTSVALNQTASSSAIYIDTPGDGTSGVYVWGAQFEEGSFPTSYIPTSGSTVTRAADLAKITGTNFTDFYNQSEGTFFIDSAVARGSAYQGYVGSTTNSTANGGPSYNFNSLMSDADNSDILLNIWDGTGSAQAMISIAHPSGNMKAAGAFKNNDFAFSMNGSTVSTDTSGTIDTNQDQLWIGRRPYANTGWLNNSIKRVVYYNKRLPNAQLQGLTQQ